VFLAQQSASARARQAAQPAHEGAARRGPTRQREEEGLTARSVRRRGGEPVGSTAGDAHDGSPPGSRFRDGEVVARHGWRLGVRGVGSI
jgi:hypothetical protein